jgi:hypothetical protein
MKATDCQFMIVHNMILLTSEFVVGSPPRSPRYHRDKYVVPLIDRLLARYITNRTVIMTSTIHELKSQVATAHSKWINWLNSGKMTVATDVVIAPAI